MVTTYSAATATVTPPVTVEQRPSYMITPPTSASGTPSNTSPVSPCATFNVPPHLQLHSRQLRPQRGLMYVPAVLRPTEKPVRSSPPKNDAPKTAYGSPESLNDGGAASQSSKQFPEHFRSQLSRIVTEEWNEDILGPVTGAPSRNHWKPDTASMSCDNPMCNKAFGFWERRHHCRRCGNIFCHEHSSHAIPLDQHAKFHPSGTRNRACDACFSDYRTWETARASGSNSVGSRDSAGSATDQPQTPTVAIASQAEAPRTAKSFVGSFASSLPRDWNWSTF